MLRRMTAVALIALLGACGGDDDTAETAADNAATAELDASAAPRFALVRGQDTLLIEEFTLEGSRVSGTLRDPSGSSVEYEAIHATDGGERSMRVVMRPAGPEGTGPIIHSFLLRGDSAWLETTLGDSTSRHGDAINANALPYLSPSMGMMALVAQSGRAIVGDSGQVTLLAASVSPQPPIVVSPLVFWRADTAYVIGNEMTQFRLVFSNGRLESAENAPQQIRAVRTASVAPGTRAAPPAAPGQGGTPRQQPQQQP